MCFDPSTPSTRRRYSHHPSSPQSVIVAGATGQTGRRVVERLASKGGLSVTGGVRNPSSAAKTLSEASITVRGAMVQQVNAVDTSAVSLTKLDVVKDSVASLTEALKGNDALVIATGFIPGSPFDMKKARRNRPSTTARCVT